MIKYSFLKTRDRLSKKDVGAIRYLLKLLTSNSTRVTLTYLLKVAKNSKLLLARVSNQDNAIVGMATLVIVTIPTGKAGRVEDVVVHDGYRRKGIGKTLVKKLTSEAKRLDLKHVDLTSQPTRVEANKMYKKLGFVMRQTNVYRLDI